MLSFLKVGFFMPNVSCVFMTITFFFFFLLLFLLSQGNLFHFSIRVCLHNVIFWGKNRKFGWMELDMQYQNWYIYTHYILFTTKKRQEIQQYIWLRERRGCMGYEEGVVGVAGGNLPCSVRLTGCLYTALFHIKKDMKKRIACFDSA